MDDQRTDQDQVNNQSRFGRPNELPLRADLLLKILRRYLGRHRYCWPSQERLAADMGVSVRTVCFWIRFLEAAGEIEIERTNRSNRYYIPPRVGAQKLRPPDTQKSSYPDTQKSSYPDTQKSSYPDTQKSSCIDETPIDGITFKEGGTIEGAPSPEKKEHPIVEERLQDLRAFDAQPIEVKTIIEAAVREQGDSLDDFQWACVGLWLEWRKDGTLQFELDWAEFKRRFVRDATCKPKDDPNCDFLDHRVKRKFAPGGPFNRQGQGLTGKEMLAVLECYLDDPRRLEGKCVGKFANDFPTLVWKYVRQARERVRDEAFPRARVEPAPVEPSKDAVEPGGPIVFAVDPECVQVADALRDRIGQARFDLWFNGKARLTRAGDGFQVGTANEFLRGWISRTFGADVNAVAGGAAVKFVIDPELCERAKKR